MGWRSLQRKLEAMLAVNTTKPRVSGAMFTQLTLPADGMRAVCGFTAR
jgi:hypothetical protein